MSPWSGHLSMIPTRGRKLGQALRSGRILDAVRGRPFPSIEHDPIRDLEVDYVIDVGANRGQFASWVEQAWPSARIDCFEPLPEAHRALVRWAPDGVSRAVKSAVGSERATKSLFVTGADDSSSLLAPVDQRRGSPFRTVDRVEVPVAPLDDLVDTDLLAGRALLKIDVQGAELEVLLGASRTLPELDYVLVEVSFAEMYRGQPLAGGVVDFLVSNGFWLAGAHGVTPGPRGVVRQCDLLFIPRARGTDGDQ